MHELSICQGLLRQLATMTDQHQGQLTRVVLQIGPLSGVEPDLLQAAFVIAAKGTVATAAELVIERSPLRVHCPLCDAESEASANDLRCGRCNNQQTRLISGDELMLVSIQFSEESNHV